MAEHPHESHGRLPALARAAALSGRQAADRKAAGSAPTAAPVTSEAMTALQGALWQLLADRAVSFTGGASTSLPAEQAEGLLSSLCFTLGIGPALTEPQAAALLAHPGGLAGALAAREKALARRTRFTKILWQQAVRQAPPLPSLALRDTLQSIGRGFALYDRRFAADQFPCDIDYPLCLPVSEQLQGVDYLAEWLRTLLTEWALLRSFDVAVCRAVLEATCPDPWGQLINLYEPVAVNALGCVLANEPVAELALPESALARLGKIWGGLSAEQCRQTLEITARQLAARLGLGQHGSRYLAVAAAALVPRLQAALAAGNLRGVFPLPGAGWGGGTEI